MSRPSPIHAVNTLDSAEKVAAPNGAAKKSGRKLSSELEAMHRIDKILAALPGVEGARVVQWLLSKYAVGQQTFDPNT